MDAAWAWRAGRPARSARRVVDQFFVSQSGLPLPQGLAAGAITTLASVKRRGESIRPWSD